MVGLWGSKRWFYGILKSPLNPTKSPFLLHDMQMRVNFSSAAAGVFASAKNDKQLEQKWHTDHMISR